MENHIGNNIKKIAEAKNLKPQDIAYRWNKSTQAVYDMYNKQFPKADVIIEMCRILNVPANEILGIQENYTKALQENDQNTPIIQDLLKQLSGKDKQIEFLQKMIEDFQSERKKHQ